ncbi:MAG: AsmA family protein, partial [Campylobacteraceae bacterium]|nr:AsmA family protein [Campylobacteraceae bacterium]
MKWFKYAVIFLILGLTLILTLFTSVVDKKDISSYISKQTNSEITFESYGLSFYPELSLKLRGVTYDDAKTAKAIIKELSIGFSLKDLLLDFNPTIKSIYLTQPNITLYQTNKSNKKVEVNKSSSIIDIQNLYVKNAKISYDTYAVENLDLHLGITNSVLDVKNLYIQSWKAIKDIKLKGKIDLKKENTFYDVDISFEKSGIEKIAQKLNIDLPKLKDKQALQNISFFTKIQGDSKKLYLKDSKIHLDESMISFETEINNLNPYSMKNSILIDKINLNRYLEESKQPKSTVNYESIFTELRKMENTLSLSIKELQIKNQYLSNVSFQVKVSKAKVNIKPVTFELNQGKFKGEYQIDVRTKNPKVTLKQSAQDVNLSELFDKKTNILKGKINLDLNLNFTGYKQKDIAKTLRGTKKIWGKSITLEQYDVDKILAKFEETKKVNLLDIGAIFIAGPFAGLLTQGSKFALLKNEVDKKGRTNIKAFSSVWTFKNNKAVAKDVAVKTSKNIIALKGSINLKTKKFDDIQIAVLDKNRCAKFMQSFEGDLSKNDIKLKENVAATFL